MANKIEKVVYQAHASATGGRDGSAKSSDGLLDVKLSVPKEMGGAGGGVNPEQLFAAGYSACFLGAMGFVAAQQKKLLPSGTKVTGDVGIGPIPQCVLQAAECSLSDIQALGAQVHTLRDRVLAHSH